jgi:hypothetical protein
LEKLEQDECFVGSKTHRSIGEVFGHSTQPWLRFGSAAPLFPQNSSGPHSPRQSDEGRFMAQGCLHSFGRFRSEAGMRG